VGSKESYFMHIYLLGIQLLVLQKKKKAPKEGRKGKKNEKAGCGLKRGLEQGRQAAGLAHR
jgi:hypothetical protein